MKASRDGKSGGGGRKPRQGKPAREPRWTKIHEVRTPVRGGVPVHRRFRRHRSGRIKNEQIYSRQKDIERDPEMWRAQNLGAKEAGHLQMRRDRDQLLVTMRIRAERRAARKARGQRRRAAVARMFKGTDGPRPTPDYQPLGQGRRRRKTIGQPDPNGYVNPENGPLLGRRGWKPPWRR